MTYNLIDDPWIPVTTTDNKHGNASLRTLFDHIDQIHSIDDGDPMQRFAITRLLLTIKNAADDPTDKWPRTVLDYLETRHHLFDLQDPDKPFLQTPNLTPMGKGGDKGIEPLHPHIKRALWTNLPLRAPISPAQAARLLLVARTYDVAGIHTGMIGDPHAKAGKVPPRGVAQAGNLFLTILHGTTLRQTLELNDMPHIKNDKPIWDITVEHPGDMTLPMTGPNIAYTWPCRRIRLLWNSRGDQCTGAYVTYGDRSDWTNRQAEPCAFWNTDGKKPGPQHMNYGTMHCTPMTEVPIWYKWTRLMNETNRPLTLTRALNSGSMIDLETFDIEWGQQNAVIQSTRNDRLTIHPATIRNQEHMQTIIDTIVKRNYPKLCEPDTAAETWRTLDDAMRDILAGNTSMEQAA